MKIYRYLAIAAFSVCFLIANAKAADLTVGKTAPAFEIKTMTGKSITPTTAKGRVLVINVWATWCLPCRKEMPELEQFYRKYHDRGVDVVAVSINDDKDTVNKVMKSFSFPAAMESDTDLHRFGQIWRIPVTFIIDRNGVLRRNGWEGGDPRVDQLSLERMVTPLLAPRASN